MATFKLRGFDEYIAQLERIDENSDETIKRAVYAGAGVVADAVKSELDKLPVGPYQYAPKGFMLSTITTDQLKDLQGSFGISKFQEYAYGVSSSLGFTNVKLGFDGYGSTPTTKYANGVPNSMLARSIESGTSFRQKNPFVRRATNAVKNEAVEVMGETITDEIKKLT